MVWSWGPIQIYNWFQFRVFLLLDWSLFKVKESSLPYHLPNAGMWIIGFITFLVIYQTFSHYFNDTCIRKISSKKFQLWTTLTVLLTWTFKTWIEDTLGLKWTDKYLKNLFYIFHFSKQYLFYNPCYELKRYTDHFLCGDCYNKKINLHDKKYIILLNDLTKLILFGKNFMKNYFWNLSDAEEIYWFEDFCLLCGLLELTNNDMQLFYISSLKNYI